MSLPKTTKPQPVVTAKTYKNNGEFIKEVSKLYIKEGDRIADITYGRGIFWREIDLRKYRFFPSDKITHSRKFDFRNLPYKEKVFDIVVFDPPYVHSPGRRFRCNGTYQNSATTKGLTHRDIIDLYRAGLEEVRRILKPNGLLLVKCMDEIESNRQKWSHIEIFQIAQDIGFLGEDLFVYMQNSTPTLQAIQKHARKNHSYLWVLKKIGNQ